jgi:predicted enzyme related to lactoylglutathione lyase
MDMHSNVINWFEIAVSDIERATKFYETIFSVKMEPWEGPDLKMALFPADSAKGVLGGALAQSPWHHPSGAGVVIYLNANPDLINVLNRIEAAGGSIIMPKTLITEQIGYMACFTDTEGNTIALHSNN